MATTENLGSNDPKALYASSDSVTSTNEIAHTVTITAPCVIRSVYYEIPNGSTITATLTAVSGGAAIKLYESTATAAETGAFAAGRPIMGQGTLAIVTTGGISGAKKTDIIVSPCQIGV